MVEPAVRYPGRLERQPTTVRPRVLRLITRLNIGGPARQALLLTRELRPEYETTLAAGTPEDSEGELTHASVHVHRVPLVRPLNPTADLRALQALRRLMLQKRPHLLHTHMAKAGTLGRLAAIQGRAEFPLVHTFHGHVLQGYFTPRAQRAFTSTERWLAARTDVLVAISTEIRDELLDLGIGRPDQYVVIPLGLDLAPFLSVRGGTGHLRALIGVSSQTPLVGVIGRLVPIKDHLTLLMAMERLPGVHLAIIGDGELRAELEATVQRLGLGPRVHFTGWWRAMEEAVSDLDVVALTSRNEGTPVALIEAGAAAVPVVATDVGGVRSVVQEGVTGLLAKPGDDEGFARLIRGLLNDPASRHRMGSAARSHVEQRFGAERLLRDIQGLYRNLLLGSQRSKSKR